MELEVLVSDDSVSLGCPSTDTYLDAFLDVYIDSELSPSPFKTIADAEIFVRIVKKVLEKFCDDG